MKRTFSITFAMICAFFPILVNSQANCGDPGGCSIVSYAAFQNRVDTLLFGNTTGKVYQRKSRLFCSGASCNNLFVASTALAGPLADISDARSKDIQPKQVFIGVEIREINSKFTEILGIDYPSFLDNKPLQDVGSKAKLNSGYPSFVGAGDTGLMHIAPATNNQLKVVHQLLRKSDQNDVLKSPTILQKVSSGLISATVNRDLSLQISVEAQDDLNVRLILQPINENRRKAGSPDIFLIPPTNPQSNFERIPSVSTTPLLSDLPVLGHLFAHKRLRQNNRGDELAIFITPVIVQDSDRVSSAQLFILGPPIQITNFALSSTGPIDFFQTLAIDPKGQFLVYAEFSKKCKKNILKYVPFDLSDLFRSNTASTMLQAKAKILAGCGSFKNSSTGPYGLDVINLD